MTLTAVVLKVCFDASIPVLVTRGLGLGGSQLVNEAAALAQRDVILASPDFDHGSLLEDIGASPAVQRALAATQPSVLFIDGLDRINPQLQLQFVALVRDRRLGEQLLPSNVTVIVTAEKETVYGTLRALSPYVHQYSMF